MVRPCFLVIDQECSGSISTRKLVIETAKFNVITAYSAEEAIECLRRFPAIDGAVVDSGIAGMPCGVLVRALRLIVPGLLVIGVGMNGGCPGADHQLDSFEPERLLTLLHHLFPQAAAAVEQKNEELKLKESERKG